MILLYGVRSGNEDWQEELLATQCKTKEQIERVKEVASKDGFGRFRVAQCSDNPEPPDFSKTINL